MFKNLFSKRIRFHSGRVEYLIAGLGNLAPI